MNYLPFLTTRYTCKRHPPVTGPKIPYLTTYGKVLKSPLASNRLSLVAIKLQYNSKVRMVDPASIAGLTIAIFDQLLKLGERSAELTADIRAFTDVGESARYVVLH